MNVTVENLAPCKKLVRIEIEAKEVDETHARIVKSLISTLPAAIR